jgi:N-acetylmuramoyl-L-alanine amidase
MGIDRPGYLQQHGTANLLVRHGSVVVVLVLLLLSGALGTNVFGVFAQPPCARGDKVHVVVSGDTLSGIAAHYKIRLERLVSYNHIANPNLIYINESICIPGVRKPLPTPTPPLPVKGIGNFFPYGQCTWYASQRYFELHHVYVPWTTHADAWQWTRRAQDFHWHISDKPSVGAIVNLQPWVEGAYDLGHVAVVEKILPNGDVLASNMNWGIYSWEITYTEFTPGPGVTFITY